MRIPEQSKFKIHQIETPKKPDLYDYQEPPLSNSKSRSYTATPGGQNIHRREDADSGDHAVGFMEVCHLEEPVNRSYQIMHGHHGSGDIGSPRQVLNFESREAQVFDDDNLADKEDNMAGNNDEGA